jgi:hypothetical protein
MDCAAFFVYFRQQQARNCGQRCLQTSHLLGKALRHCALHYQAAQLYGGIQALAPAPLHCLLCNQSSCVDPFYLDIQFIALSLHFAGTQLQWPRGGPQAIADALVWGLRKHGGKLLLNCHVQQVIQGPGGKAAGVQLQDGGVIRARRAVVSNASTWDTRKLLPQGAELQHFAQQVGRAVVI